MLAATVQWRGEVRANSNDRANSPDRALTSEEFVRAIANPGRWERFSGRHKMHGEAVSGKLQPLPPHQLLDAMRTPHQFKVLGDSSLPIQPGQQAYIGFHGAPADRWFGILLDGFKNGDVVKRRGCPGISLSCRSRTSAAYMQTTATASGCCLGAHLTCSANMPRCLGLCEFVTTAGRFCQGGADIMQLPDVEAVRLLYLFVYTQVEQEVPDVWIAEKPFDIKAHTISFTTTPSINRQDLRIPGKL